MELEETLYSGRMSEQRQESQWMETASSFVRTGQWQQADCYTAPCALKEEACLLAKRGCFSTEPFHSVLMQK